MHAGYGIFYDQSSLAPGEGLYFNKPYYDFRLYFPLPGLPLTLNNPFPPDYPLAIPASALGFDRNLRTPYMQHWNLAFEHQFGTQSLVEVAYVGSKGNKILSARDINQPNAKPGSDPIQGPCRSLPTSFSWSPAAVPPTTACKPASSSVSVRDLPRSSPTPSASRWMKPRPSSRVPGMRTFPQNSSNPGAEKGRSNFDVRHRLSIGFSYDLPFGAGRRFAVGVPLVSSLLAGWSAHGIVTLQSGRPFTVALLPEIDNSNTGMASLGFGANNRPDRIASGVLRNPGTREVV